MAVLTAATWLRVTAVPPALGTMAVNCPPRYVVLPTTMIVRTVPLAP